MSGFAVNFYGRKVGVERVFNQFFSDLSMQELRIERIYSLWTLDLTYLRKLGFGKNQNRCLYFR